MRFVFMSRRKVTLQAASVAGAMRDAPVNATFTVPTAGDLTEAIRNSERRRPSTNTQ